MSPKASRSRPTIRMRASNKRAGKDIELLFYRLEHFVNLGDDPSVWKNFGEEYPEFFPVQFHTDDELPEVDEEPRKELASYEPEFYQLFRTFRDFLREVWRSGSDKKLAILLGVDPIAWQIIARTSGAPQVEEFLGGPYAEIEKAMAKISSYFQSGPSNLFYPSNLVPDWRTGTFRYIPDTEFRRAVYALFRQSWRAKICPRCGKYFVGDKPPQTYCSSKCYGEAKKDRDLQFWRTIGSERRARRTGRRVRKVVRRRR